ncbi:unnamed protein product [Cercopithifilaria johnstoni]|uniref:Uncharacterized protein n=1 Tax=Cercopithifilaria johnstoni TaxID=2874296 RepID=A0A8J2M0D4_9BILA|nr:unnamed protein product [Cercopithifilaria johnstoni]
MLPHPNRPRDLRITPASSSSVMRTTDNTGNNITSKHTTGMFSTSFRVHGTSGNTTPANGGGPSTSVVVDEMVPINSAKNSRKVK